MLLWVLRKGVVAFVCGVAEIGFVTAGSVRP